MCFPSYVTPLANTTKDILYHLVSKVKIFKLNTFILIEKIIEWCLIVKCELVQDLIIIYKTLETNKNVCELLSIIHHHLTNHKITPILVIKVVLAKLSNELPNTKVCVVNCPINVREITESFEIFHDYFHPITN